MYALAVLPVLVLGWYAYYVVFPPMLRLTIPIAVSFSGAAPDIPAWLLATGYGITWAGGMAAHPFVSVRGARAFAYFGLLFVAGCSLLAALLFRPGPLEELL
jgi:hypothetical protein